MPKKSIDKYDDKLEIIYDHYKITVEQIKKKEKDRDSLFLYLLIALSIALLFSIKPADSTHLLNIYIQSNMVSNLDITPYFYIIEMFLWTLLFYISLRYFQRVISVKNKINYMRQLEQEIQEIYFTSKLNFCRDSRFYDKNSALLTKFARKFYSFVFPIVYFIIVLFKINEQLNLICKNNFHLNNVFTLAILILIATLIFFYIVGQFKLETKKNT